MYRRSRCLADFETANKNLDRARSKNKDLPQAETNQQEIKKKFENMSEKAKIGKRERKTKPIRRSTFHSLRSTFDHLELTEFKNRRVQMFRKNLIELAELHIKHTKVKQSK